MKKRFFFFLLLTLCLMLCVTGASASAGVVGDFEYEDHGDGTISIVAYTGHANALVIPSKLDGKLVTEVGGFWNNGLSAVVIPEGVKTIGNQAFFGCGNLSEIVLPSTLEGIAPLAFVGCNNLSEINLPDNIQYIFYESFWDCPARLNASIGSTTAYALGGSGYSFYGGGENVILEYLFYDGKQELAASAMNRDIEYAVIPQSVKHIHDFGGCRNLTSFVVPEGVTHLDDSAFSYCEKLAEISLPSTLNVIGNGAFFSCSSLSDIALPAALTAIGDHAFDSTGLSELILPDNVRDFGLILLHNYATIGSVTAHTISRTTGRFSAVGYDNVHLQYLTLQENEEPELVAFPYGDDLGTVVIPQGVTRIREFLNQPTLTSVFIPEGVTHIDHRAFEGCWNLAEITLPSTLSSIGGSAFAGCSALSSVAMPDNVTQVGGAAFNDCPAHLYTRLDSATAHALSEADAFFSLRGNDNVVLQYRAHGEGTERELTAFGYDHEIQSAVIPAEVKHISYFSFTPGLTSIVIPEGVTHIDDEAFRDCKNLTEVTLPSTLSSIGVQAFANCDSLSSVTLPDNVSYFGLRTFVSSPVRLYATIGSVTAHALCEENLYFFVSGNDGIALQYRTYEGEEEPALVAVKYENDPEDPYYYEKIETLVFPEGVTHINNFNCCFNLTSVVIPEGVTHIDGGAFDYCYELAELTLPSTLQYIGDYAFCRCFSLRAAAIPDSVTEIGENIFPKASETLYVGCSSYALDWAVNHGYPSPEGIEPGAYHYVPVHDWDAPVYTWADDHSSVTAAQVCGHDASHAESETVGAQWVLTRSPTDTVKGERSYYSADFRNSAFEKQTVSAADVPALNTLQGLRLPAALTAVEAEAFNGGSFQFVILPSTCTDIGARAFANCQSLRYIRIPASVTVAADAFLNCSGSLIIDRLA